MRWGWVWMTARSFLSKKKRTPNRSVTAITLEEDTSDLPLIRKVLLQLSERVSRRMRKDFFYGQRVILTIRYSDFYTFTKQKTLAQPINSGNEIFTRPSGSSNRSLIPNLFGFWAWGCLC